MVKSSCLLDLDDSSPLFLAAATQGLGSRDRAAMTVVLLDVDEMRRDRDDVLLDVAYSRPNEETQGL